MTYEVKQEQGISIIVLTGEIDLHKSPVARLKILGCLEKGVAVLVDLAGVEYIDSSGVASLVEGFQLAKKKGVKFGLMGVSAAAMNVLKLARLDKVFPLYTSVQECLDQP